MRTISVIIGILTHNTSVILRLTIFFTLCISILQAAPNREEAMRELEKVPSYQLGAKAMADLLPDLALRQFRAALKEEKLSENAQTFVTMDLAEALIRASVTSEGTDTQATEALTLLSGDAFKDLPATPVWKAQALAVLGHYQQAEATLAKIDAKHPQYHETRLARARILIALKRKDDALILLQSLNEAKSAKTRNHAHLLSAEIYIDRKEFANALQSLDEVDGQTPTTAQLREYLKARLSLAENKAADAISGFRSLITEPDHLSKRIYHACVLGLADALIANDNQEDATATLEDYITNNPNSPILQPIFQRLGKLLSPDLPADNPSLQRLILWSGEYQPAPNALYISGDTADAIRPYQPAPSEHDDLVTLSLHLRSQLLARSDQPEKLTQALSLLTRIRSLHPAHSLPPSELYLEVASASLLDTAEIQLKQKRPEQATFTLASMEKTAFSPLLKDQASFVLGLLKVKETAYQEALDAFDFARESSSKKIASAASINTGISALLSNNLPAFDQVIQATDQTKIRTSLELERALWKCQNNDIAGRADLEKFIMANPQHPRVNEARLALAASCVDISPPDIILAKAQLEIIRAQLSTAAGQYAITRIHIRAEELTQNWRQAAAAAEVFIRDFPTSQHIPGVMLKQGEAYYHNEDFNKARRIFQTINEQFPDSPFTPYASFYSAMAARLGGTTQAREESVGLFQKIIDGNNPLANEARIQQSRVLIDLRRYDEAQKTLKPVLESAKTSVTLRRDAGILMADSLHRQASSDPQKYQQAVNIYDQLLAGEKLPLAWKNRLHFLRGQTLESMKRTDDALDSYYKVIIDKNAPKNPHGDEVEWFWFYRCGFKALSMLENQKRWEAAVKLAKRIATFDGPRAEEAYKRADNLAKTHMIWEEE